MARCARCCLHNSLRVVNLITNLCAVGMIVYALWLQKKWNEGVAELPSTAYCPRPWKFSFLGSTETWFIYTCLGVGIAVCLSTLFGHMVVNCISNSTLFIYIITICSLVLLEAAVVVAIFFRIDWQLLITEYIDEHHTEFRIFVVFHLKMCQLIAIFVLLPQISIVALAITLWFIGIGPRSQRNDSETPTIIQSFLIGPNLSMLEGSRHNCSSCSNLLEGNPQESFWSYIKGLIRIRFQRTTVN